MFVFQDSVSLHLCFLTAVSTHGSSSVTRYPCNPFQHGIFYQSFPVHITHGRRPSSMAVYQGQTLDWSSRLLWLCGLSAVSSLTEAQIFLSKLLPCSLHWSIFQIFCCICFWKLFLAVFKVSVHFSYFSFRINFILESFPYCTVGPLLWLSDMSSSVFF